MKIYVGFGVQNYNHSTSNGLTLHENVHEFTDLYKTRMKMKFYR